MISLIPVEGLPEIEPGADLARLIVEHTELRDGDVLVVAQKVISKQEGRRVALHSVRPTQRALEMGSRIDRDPRMVQLVLDEAVRVLRDDPVLIVETRGGFVCANAGVDASNTGAAGHVTLLPVDCDATAAAIRRRISELRVADVGVVISDTFGRPWRLGICNVALGVSGLPAMIDRRGDADDDGRRMQATQIAVADEIASAAGLVMEKTARIPAVVVRGLHFRSPPGTGRDLLRPAALDLFR